MGFCFVCGSLTSGPTPGESCGGPMGEKREVILEYQQIGNAVRVAAVDPDTLTEVSIVGSASAGIEVLKRTAIQKLKYVLGKQQGSV